MAGSKPATTGPTGPTALGVTMATTTRKVHTTTTTTTTPRGTTTTTTAGTPQGQVPHLAAALAALAAAGHLAALATPAAAWPGWGKAVRVQGTGWAGAMYANRGNVDVRCPHAVAAAVAAAGLGTVRGQGQYVRVPYSATGTPQA